MTSTLRAQLARSRHKQAGSKRIEVVLDAEALGYLERLKTLTGLKNGDAISMALVMAVAKENLRQARATACLDERQKGLSHDDDDGKDGRGYGCRMDG